jgi:hypothetical protein
MGGQPGFDYLDKAQAERRYRRHATETKGIGEYA